MIDFRRFVNEFLFLRFQNFKNKVDLKSIFPNEAYGGEFMGVSLLPRHIHKICISPKNSLHLCKLNIRNMTQEEHNILVENNLMLKEIIMYLYKYSRDDTFRQFIINVIADKVAENL